MKQQAVLCPDAQADSKLFYWHFKSGALDMAEISSAFLVRLNQVDNKIHCKVWYGPGAGLIPQCDQTRRLSPLTSFQVISSSRLDLSQNQFFDWLHQRFPQFQAQQLIHAPYDEGCES